MTARVNRQAVLVLTWIVVTTTATAVAWLAVTFVTTEVADRGPLRPSDVVAASVRQVVPVPSWVSGARPAAGAPPSTSDPTSDSPADFVSAVPASALDPTAVHSSGASRVAAPAAAPSVATQLASVAGPRLVARWSSTASSSHVAAAAVTAVTPPAPATPAPTVPPVVLTSSPEFALVRRTGFSTATPAASATPSAPATQPVAATTRPADPATVRRHFRQSGQKPACPQPEHGPHQTAASNS